jgi:acyl dehydratase
MKSLISILAVTIALAFTGPVFAGDVTTAKTEADCKAAGGMWDAATNTCSEKKM